MKLNILIIKQLTLHIGLLSPRRRFDIKCSKINQKYEWQISEDGRIGVANASFPIMSFIDIDKITDHFLENEYIEKAAECLEYHKNNTVEHLVLKIDLSYYLPVCQG